MISYRPTPLDLALAADPIAEADSRAIAAAAAPPDWTRLDAAAQAYAAAFKDGRQRLMVAAGARLTQDAHEIRAVASAA